MYIKYTYYINNYSASSKLTRIKSNNTETKEELRTEIKKLKIHAHNFMRTVIKIRYR